MITVQILINLDTLHTVSAINVGSEDSKTFEYEVFEGINRGKAKEVKSLTHVRADGASTLAIKMLEAFPSKPFTGYRANE